MSDSVPDRNAVRQVVRTVVADNIRVARARMRMSQEKVAAGMRKRGFDNWSRVTVSEVERYNRQVGVEELIALASVLDTPINDLLSGQIRRQVGMWAAQANAEKIIAELRDAGASDDELDAVVAAARRAVERLNADDLAAGGDGRDDAHRSSHPSHPSHLV